MFSLLGLLGATLLSAAPPAASLEAQAHEANRRGAEFATRGQLTEAIAEFKRAELLVPRFEHHCNVGRAYALLERWEQAWVFLDDCRARAGRNAKRWVPTLIERSEKTLAAAGASPVTVVSETLVSVSFPALAEDEAWRVVGRRVFWLPPGPVEVRFTTADGSWTQTLDGAGPGRTLVATRPEAPPPVVEKAPEPIALAPVETPPDAAGPSLEPVTVAPAPEVKAALVVTTERRRPVGALVLGGVGVASLVAGGVLYGVARGSLAEANELEPGPAFDAVRTRYERERLATYLTLGAGAVLVAAGLVWWLAGGEVAVTPALGPDGAGVQAFARF